MSTTDQWGKVYPRTGGGTAYVDGIALQVKGLSPHGRGNQQRVLVQRDAEGSIPARAGEPLPSNRLIMLNC